MPLHLIIDGYNLIGINHRDLRLQRDQLIERLIRYKKIKGHQIVVVFDGYKSGRGKREILDQGGIKVIFTKDSETTDEFLSTFLETSGLQWVVVSSDRFIQKEAWRNNCVPVSSEEFHEALTKALGEAGEEDSEYFHNMEIKEKRHLSKKEKILSRILKKL